MDANEQRIPQEQQVVEKDTSYSPASDRETARMQQEPVGSGQVTLPPGTGGPDDSGDVRVDDSELNFEHGGNKKSVHGDER